MKEWVNFFTEHPEADERGFARDVAERIGAGLTEQGKIGLKLEPDRIVAAMTGPRPSLNVLDWAYDEDLARRAGGYRHPTLLTGQGGDGVLFSSRTPLIAADILGSAAMWGGAPRMLMSLSRWTQSSVWALMRDGAVALARPTWAAAGRRSRSWRHPWLDFPRGTPPAKRFQIHNLLAAQVFNGACARSAAADLIHPLLAQPVVELCLRLPTPVLTQARRDRAFARSAFSTTLPTSVLTRRSKGDLTRFYGEALVEALTRLRPFLLEGALAQEGLVDVDGLAGRLTYEDLVWRGDYAGLFQLIATEAWVRRWSR